MIYPIDKILKDVRVCMDQNGSVDALFESGDIDSLMLDDMIRSKVTAAVDMVHNQAQCGMLELGHTFCDDYPGDGVEDSQVYWGEQESGWVMLPDDFMRLVVFEMSDWERPVYSVITPDDAEYKHQRSRIKALRGTSQRPVCALCKRPDGNVLEFYSCKSTDATVTKAVYIPYASIDSHGGVDISERCYTAVVNAAAGLTLVSCGEAEKASVFFETSKQNLTK